MGGFLSLAFGTVAAAAALFEMFLQDALDVKAGNGLAL
jgi:hypothetical protein